MIDEDTEALLKESTQLDHTVIWGIVPPKSPTSGLTFRNGKYYLVYYTQDERTASLCLKTADLIKAQKLRDLLYDRARRSGVGHISKIARRAAAVLKDPQCDAGVWYACHFANKVGKFRTWGELVKWRTALAKSVVASAREKRV